MIIQNQVVIQKLGFGMSNYTINPPVDFTNITPGSIINADATPGKNRVQNFVTTSPGDLITRTDPVNNFLDRLPIGNNGDVLTVVTGLPGWAPPTPPPVTNSKSFTAHVTASTGTISSSSGTGAWVSLSGVAPKVTWSTAAPGGDSDGAFNLVAGAGYGRYTIPLAGFWTFSAQVTFDGVPSGNGGSGFPGGSLPAGKGCRQIQIWNVTTTTILACASVQTVASNSNQTVVNAVAHDVSVALNDVIEVRVRHDAPTNNVTIGDVTVATSFQTYFFGRFSRT